MIQDQPDTGLKPLAEIAARWRGTAILKRDVFSTIERGFFRLEHSEVQAIARHIGEVPWWSRPLAKHFLGREAKGLAAAADAGIAARPLFIGKSVLVRSWLDGLPIQIARPANDAVFFRTARSALLALKRRGIAHNDLAKEQNWLRGADGKAYLLDFQLAMLFPRRGRLFRMAAAEDLRHLLKHKRKYLPAALTPRERRFLTQKSIPNRIWMSTGKKIYSLITRGIFGYSDREGGGPRLAFDAPVLIERLRRMEGVREAEIVAYPDRRRGTGLYAFVESSLDAKAILQQLAGPDQSLRAPELLQVVEALPRDNAGNVRKDILQLIATNQLDEMDWLLAASQDASAVRRIIDRRLNLRDRHSF